MKKTILAIALGFTLLATFSCNKDDDNNNKASIIGTWTTVSQSSKTYEGTSTTPTDEDSYDPTTDGVQATEFKTDNTFTTTTTALDGSTDIESGTYTYDAGSKKMTITQDFITIPFDVKTLTSSSLVIHGELSSIDPTTNTTVKLVVDATFKR